MRITLAAEGTRGDVHPMLALGISLQEAGHRVRLCASPDFADDASERGLEFAPVGEPIRPYLTSNASALHGNAWDFMRETRSFMETSLRAQFRVLRDTCEDADLVIGAGVQMAASSAAEFHRTPYRYIAYCPVILPSPEHPPAVVRSQTWPRWGNRLGWKLCRGLFNHLLRSEVNRERRKLSLRPVGDVFRYFLTRRPVLAADPELAPTPVAPGFQVERVRCLHPRSGDPLPAKLESFLEAGPPPVYLGFGSMTDPDPARTTRQVLDAVTALGCRTLISEGWAGLGGVPLPETVFPVGTVSHARLFPRCAAIVHHGGAGTTTTAARAGAPQLVVPHLLDQFYWSHRVWQLGLGPRALNRTAFSPAGLAEALAGLVDNEMVAERARELGERLARSDPGERDAVEILTNGH